MAFFIALIIGGLALIAAAGLIARILWSVPGVLAICVLMIAAAMEVFGG